jgi:hypothetical protein
MTHGKKRGAAAVALAALGLLAAFVATIGSGSAGAAEAASTTTTTASTPPPRNTQPPTLTGTPEEGQTLTATNGAWSGSNLKYVYRFQRCDKNGGNCFTGGSTTQKTYKLTDADVGKTIRVRVTATNSGGSATATSVPSSVIKGAAKPAPSNGCPSGTGPINASQISLPARLLIDGQSASPSIITRSTMDLTMRFHVSACNGRAVAGALVYAAAVPFNQFSISEVPTGTDGWATLTEHQQSGFPASSKQQLLAVFVRARKPGENLLGGVSARILVSFPVRR